MKVIHTCIKFDSLWPFETGQDKNRNEAVCKKDL